MQCRSQDFAQGKRRVNAGRLGYLSLSTAVHLPSVWATIIGMGKQRPERGCDVSVVSALWSCGVRTTQSRINHGSRHGYRTPAHTARFQAGRLAPGVGVRIGWVARRARASLSGPCACRLAVVPVRRVSGLCVLRDFLRAPTGRPPRLGHLEHPPRPNSHAEQNGWAACSRLLARGSRTPPQIPHAPECETHTLRLAVFQLVTDRSLLGDTATAHRMRIM